MRAPTFASLIVCSLVACGSDDNPQTPDASGVADAPGAQDAQPDAPSGCPRTAAAADRTRHVVVAKPYDTAGMKASVFEVLELSATGTLTRPGRTFTMGRAAFGVVAFTPDGQVGMVAQEMGTVGVFRIDPAGAVTVVEAAFAGEFYASSVVADPDGAHAWILDSNTRENGGGLYRVTIGCDGTLSDPTLVAPARLPRGLAIRDDRMVVAAGNILDSMTAGDDVYLLDRTAAAPAPIDGTDAFGDDEAIIGGTATTFDGAAFLLGDTWNSRSRWSGSAACGDAARAVRVDRG